MSLLTAHCGVVSLCCHDMDCSVTVSSQDGTSLPTHGQLCDTEWQRICPENQVLLGFGGRSGLYMDQLILRCAPVAVESDGLNYIVTTGPTTDLEPAGGSGGSVFEQTDCPAYHFATVTQIRSGTIIDAFALGCQSATVSIEK